MAKFKIKSPLTAGSMDWRKELPQTGVEAAPTAAAPPADGRAGRRHLSSNDQEGGERATAGAGADNADGGGEDEGGVRGRRRGGGNARALTTSWQSLLPRPSAAAAQIRIFSV